MTSLERDNAKLRQALHLIKIHIEGSENRKRAVSANQDRDLHSAVQLIVDVARKHGMLLPDSTAKFYEES